MAELFQFPLLFEDDPSPKTSVPASSSFRDELPPDWRERNDALDIRRSWIVEAPAGSGKTGLLIQRLLKLLGDDTVSQPEEVLAITFTRAASEEIRSRVLAQLEAASETTPVLTGFDLATREFASSVLERDHQLGWNLLGNPRRLNIRTIDSVCTQIRTALPLHSGGVGPLETTEDADDLYREGARNVLLRLGGSDEQLNEALSTVLFHRDADLTNCENLLVEMLRVREQWGDFLPLYSNQADNEFLERDTRTRLDLALQQTICYELRRLEDAFPPLLLKRLAETAADLSVHSGYRGVATPLAVWHGRYTPPEASIEDLDHWRALLHLLVKSSDERWRSSLSKNTLGFEIDKLGRERLRELITAAKQTPGLLAAIIRVMRLPSAHYPEEQWKVVKALFRVLREAVTELQTAFAREGRCDFVESALQARNALRKQSSAADLQAALGLEFQHLLVDEMQDTSSNQYELLTLLTQHWSGERRTLFLVGDPKQSIYLFRQARVERFLRMMREGRLGSRTLGALRLTANFRSQVPLIDSLNEDFRAIFPLSPAADDTIVFQPVEAARARAVALVPNAGRVWHTQTIDRDRSSPAKKTLAKLQARRQEARNVREIIERWRSRPLPSGRTSPWRIAVLVRARQHLFEIVAALRGSATEPAIPCRATKIEQLGERPEILDLLSLTRALLHPADRISWLSILRAPWCGLELAELHLLTGADDPLLPEGSCRNAHRDPWSPAAGEIDASARSHQSHPALSGDATGTGATRAAGGKNVALPWWPAFTHARSEGKCCELFFLARSN